MNRNRYANVEPYDKNRVKLKVPEGYSDYINASLIELTPTKSRTTMKFIATQVGTYVSCSILGEKLA